MRAFKLIEKLDIINERPVQPVKIVAAGDYTVTPASKPPSREIPRPQVKKEEAQNKREIITQ